MALLITDQCINCDVCEPVCPNQAIYPGHKLYHITPERCTECVGHFDVPQCVEVCPVECIFVDNSLAESKADLTAKYQQLTSPLNLETVTDSLVGILDDHIQASSESTSKSATN